MTSGFPRVALLYPTNIGTCALNLPIKDLQPPHIQGVFHFNQAEHMDSLIWIVFAVLDDRDFEVVQWLVDTFGFVDNLVDTLQEAFEVIGVVLQQRSIVW